MRRDAVHGGVVARGVELPEEPSAIGGVGVQEAADASREYDTGNRGDGRRKSRAASIAVATWDGRHLHAYFAIG
jgi:hypothetical protein